LKNEIRGGGDADGKGSIGNAREGWATTRNAHDDREKDFIKRETKMLRETKQSRGGERGGAQCLSTKTKKAECPSPRIKRKEGLGKGIQRGGEKRKKVAAKPKEPRGKHLPEFWVEIHSTAKPVLRGASREGREGGEERRRFKTGGKRRWEVNVVDTGPMSQVTMEGRGYYLLRGKIRAAGRQCQDPARK